MVMVHGYISLQEGIWLQSHPSLSMAIPFRYKDDNWNHQLPLGIYLLVIQQFAMENGSEIVDFAIKRGDVP